jgi:predicted acylesterase/phospholipase RssA
MTFLVEHTKYMLDSIPDRGKKALVLSGGGITGWLYEIGSLTALDDFFVEGFSVNDFDVYVGVSAGATVATLIANGVPAREIYESNLFQGPYYFSRKDLYDFAWREFWKSWLKIVRSLPRMAGFILKNYKDFYLHDLLNLLNETQPAGFHTLEPFESFLSRTFAEQGLSNDFRTLKRELYMPATDIDTGRYQVMGDGDYRDVPISRAVIASSAVPMFFSPVRIKGKDFIDGGIGRSAHIDIAINKGASLVLLIHPVVHVYNDRKNVCLKTLRGKEPASLRDLGFSYIYDQAWKLNTESRIYFSLKRYHAEYPDIDFMQISPPETETDLFLESFMSLRARKKVLQYGYASTSAFFETHFEVMKECFERYGIKVSLEKLRSRAKERWIHEKKIDNGAELIRTEKRDP